MVDGKTYDSKAIVGAAHGFLPGQEPLAAADFSGGAATVGRLLSGLGFQVTQAVPGLTVGELVELLSALRPYRSPSGRQALFPAADRKLPHLEAATSHPRSVAAGAA